jgi:hypothetical protein
VEGLFDAYSGSRNSDSMTWVGLCWQLVSVEAMVVSIPLPVGDVQDGRGGKLGEDPVNGGT